MAVWDCCSLYGVPFGKRRTSGPSLGFSSVGYKMDLCGSPACWLVKVGDRGPLIKAKQSGFQCPQAFQGQRLITKMHIVKLLSLELKFIKKRIKQFLASATAG